MLPVIASVHGIIISRIIIFVIASFRGKFDEWGGGCQVRGALKSKAGLAPSSAEKRALGAGVPLPLRL
jgi:hypothetical protein